MLGNVGETVGNIVEKVNASGIETDTVSGLRDAINAGPLKGISDILGELNDTLQNDAGQTDSGSEAQGVIDLPSEDDMLGTLGTSTAEIDAQKLPLEDAVVILEQARTNLNNSGVDSDLRDVVNHPGADEMFETLRQDGLEKLDVQIREDLSPEEQIQFIIEAGRDATLERGLEMPTVVADTQVPNAETPQDYSAADDDYGIA